MSIRRLGSVPTTSEQPTVVRAQDILDEQEYDHSEIARLTQENEALGEEVKRLEQIIDNIIRVIDGMELIG